MIVERLMEKEVVVCFFCFLLILSWRSLKKYSSGTSVQSRTSTAQETKDVFFPSESFEQQLNYAVQICDRHCRNAWQVVALTSVVCGRW